LHIAAEWCDLLSSCSCLPSFYPYPPLFHAKMGLSCTNNLRTMESLHEEDDASIENLKG
jgi:hypothetical protein